MEWVVFIAVAALVTLLAIDSRPARWVKRFYARKNEEDEAAKAICVQTEKRINDFYTEVVNRIEKADPSDPLVKVAKTLIQSAGKILKALPSSDIPACKWYHTTLNERLHVLESQIVRARLWVAISGDTEAAKVLIDPVDRLKFHVDRDFGDESTHEPY